MLRHCLLESATTQSDLIEIFSVIDRGLILIFYQEIFLLNFSIE